MHSLDHLRAIFIRFIVKANGALNMAEARPLMTHEGWIEVGVMEIQDLSILVLGQVCISYKP